MLKKLIIIAGCFGVSISAPLVRIASAPSLVLVLYRVALAEILLLPAAFLRNREELKRLTPGDMLLPLISGAFLGIHFYLYFESLKFTSIASSLVLVDTEVFFVAFAMLFLFHVRIPKQGWLGILAAFAGSVIIAAADSGSGSDVLKGDLLALAGAGCMAVYTMIGKKCRESMTTTAYTVLVYGASALTVLILLLLTGTPVFGYRPVDFLSALGMAVFCTLLGHSVFSWGLKYESAAFIATVKLMEPVFSTILGVILFREIPALPVVAGGIIVILGVYLYVSIPDHL